MPLIGSGGIFWAVIVVIAWIVVLGFIYILRWFDGVKHKFKR